MIIGAGWKKRDRNNNQYLSVVINIPLLGDLNLMIYPAKEKKGITSPDYNVIWIPSRNGSNNNSVVVEEFEHGDEVPF